MTTIVYDKLALYADRTNIHPGGLGARTESKKIQVSEDKQFAYASTWIACPDSDCKIFEAQIRAIIENHIRSPGDWLEGRHVTDILGKDVDELVHTKRTLVLTRNEAFMLGAAPGRVHLTTNRPQGIGSGGFFAVGRIEAGLSPVEAIAGLGMLDPQTGTEVDTFKATELDQFVYIGAKP